MDEKKRKYQEDDNDGASYAITAVVTNEDGPDTNLLPDLSSSRAQNINNIQGQMVNPDRVQNRSLTNRHPPELEEPATTTAQGNAEDIRSSQSQSTQHNENVVGQVGIRDPAKNIKLAQALRFIDGYPSELDVSSSSTSADQGNAKGIRSRQSPPGNIEDWDINDLLSENFIYPSSKPNENVVGQVAILDPANNIEIDQNLRLIDMFSPNLEEPATTSADQDNAERIRSSHSQTVNIDKPDTVAITPDNNIYPSTEHNEKVVTDPRKLEQAGVSSDQNNGEGIRSSQSQIFNINGPYDIALSIDDSTIPDTEENAHILGQVLLVDSDNNMQVVKNLSFANAEGNRSRQSQIVNKENVVGQLSVLNPVNNIETIRDLILTDICEPKLEVPETSADQGNAEGIRSRQSQAVNTANTDTRWTMSNDCARPSSLCKQKRTSETRRLTPTNNEKIVQDRSATDMLPIKEEISSSEDEIIEISSDSSQSSTESIPKVMVSMNTSSESITIDLKNQVRQKNLVEVSASFSNSVIKISSIGTNKNSEVSVSFGKIFGIKKEKVTDNEDEPIIFDSSATAPPENQSDAISHDPSSNVNYQIPSRSSSYDQTYESSNTNPSINRDIDLDFDDTSADLSSDDSHSEEIDEIDIFRPYRI